MSKLLELSPDVADIDSDTSSLRKSDTVIEGTHNSELGDLNSDLSSVSSSGSVESGNLQDSSATNHVISVSGDVTFQH